MLALVPVAAHAAKHSAPIGKLVESVGILIGLVVVGVGCMWKAGNGNKGGGSGRNGNGTGMVVGVFGRMGSGKSYFMIRMAYRRIMAGCKICSNFSMKFSHLCDGPKGCEHVLSCEIPEHKHKAVSDEDQRCAHCTKAEHKHDEACGCLTARLRSRWTRFEGWDQMMDLEDTVILVDEAHLYAPANKWQSFPDEAAWKASMLRKDECDLYYATQDESKVNTTLKIQTGMMYVCSSWFGGKWFTAKGYEPRMMRKKDKHIDRKIYRLNLKMACLYNTLEKIKPDGEHVGKGSRINELVDKRKVKAIASPVAGAPVTPTPPPGLEPDPVAPAPRPLKPAPAGRQRKRGESIRCEHEQERRRASGTCKLPACVASREARRAAVEGVAPGALVDVAEAASQGAHEAPGPAEPVTAADEPAEAVAGGLGASPGDLPARRLVSLRGGRA